MYNIRVLRSGNYVDKNSIKGLMASSLYVITSRLRTFIPDNTFIKIFGYFFLLYVFINLDKYGNTNGINVIDRILAIVDSTTPLILTIYKFYN